MEQREPKGREAGCVICVLVLPLPVLYVLSIGPFTWLLALAAGIAVCGICAFGIGGPL